MEENKVSSEKDTEVVKKTRGRPKKNKEVETVEEVVKAPEQSVEDEIAALKEEIRMLRELNAAKEAEAKKLLELSSRVLDTSVPAAHAEEKTVSVKCLELNGLELSSPNRDVVIMLPYDSWVDRDVTELAAIFKKISNRTLFEDGICILEKEEDYQRFKLKRKVFIDMDEIARVLDSGDEQAIIKKFNSLTGDKKKASVGHLLLYSIVGKSLDVEFSRLPRVSVETVENYFGVRLRDAETLLKIFRKIKE